MPFHADSSFAFKVTRGAWSREATTAQGMIPPDTWVDVHGDTVLMVHVPRWKDERAVAAGHVVGDLVHHEAFHSKIMGVERDIWVLLPRSYHENPNERYPVLYVQDGRDVFDPGRSYVGVEWRIDEVVDSLNMEGRIPDFLVVAIESTPRRMFEYADTTLGELYGRFVTEEVKPFIDGEYRTKTSREHTAAMGSGMGGLISFLLAWWYPDTFGQAACLSPIFLWGDGKTLDRLQNDPSPHPRPRLYLTTGTVGMDAELVPGMRRVCALLRKHGWGGETDLVCRIIDGAGHSEREWSARLCEALPFLFPVNEKQ